MNEFHPPSPDDLNKYLALLRLLRQVNSEMQEINDEAERFNGLLDKLGEVLHEHQLDIADLGFALTDYEVELGRVMNSRSSKQPHE